MRRREFITGIAVWPIAARAQQPGRTRRIGILINTAESPETQSQVAAFQQELGRLGWSEARDVRIDTRWGGGDAKRILQHARELVSQESDVILAAGGPVVAAVQTVSRTIPIVFSQSIDPLGTGLVASLARPGGNATGFTQFDYSLSGKWPELLKEITPQVTRVAVLRDASNPAGIGQWAVIQAMASSFALELTPLGVGEESEIERGIVDFARAPDGGLILAASALASVHRHLIIALAARHRLPAVYPYRYFVSSGGLISYGPNLVEQYRRAAGYVDRILRGEKPADLPVLSPNKYELVVNLKTAKALDLGVPEPLLARADEVIE